MRAGAALLAFLLLAPAPELTAQQTTRCDVLDRPGSRTTGSDVGLPTETLVITNAHLLCSSGRRILADHASVVKASQRIELTGNVEVRDPDRRLTSQRATFFSGTRQLAASGSVVLTDLRTGSIIRGDLLNYYEQTAERPQSRVEATATTGRARAILFAAGGAGAQDSTIVDAEQINIIGETTFRGVGNAVMTRDSMRSTGHSIEYRPEAGEMIVAGSAVVEVPAYELRGDSITALLDEGERIREVLARHRAGIDSEEMRVQAPALRLYFEDGGISRMVAMGWEPVRDQTGTSRPRVDAEEFRLESDSLDVLAPAQQLAEVVAIGDAYGERITPDSLRRAIPDAPAGVARLVAGDWVRGDTVRAFFMADARTPGDTLAPDAAAPDAPPADVPSAAGGRVLERLQAAGAPARSMYRLYDEADPEAGPSFNYLVATRIDVAFRAGAVQLVTAAGDARGVYLQPVEAAAAADRADGGGQPPPRSRR